MGNPKLEKRDTEAVPFEGASIVYVIERFPSLTEYFILNEILALEKREIAIVILSIKKPKLIVEIPELDSLTAPVFYSSHFTNYTYLSQITFVRIFTNFIRITRTCLKSSSIISIVRQLKYSLLALDFEKQLKGIRVKHVHAHFAFIASDLGYLLSKFLGVSFSFTAHAQDIYLNQKQIISKIERSCFVVTCTRYNRDYLNQLTEKKFEEKIHHVYHGINLIERAVPKERQFSDHSMVNILTVARLVEKKGIIYLLKAIKILVDSEKMIRCTIIGDGPLRNELINFTIAEGISNNVTFPGANERKKIFKQLSSADIFVLPSIVASNGDRDGLPNVLLEAMLMDVPVISTPISGIPELVEDGHSGLLIPEKDEKALVNAILKLTEDHDLYKTIIIKAKDQIMKNFAIDYTTEKLIGLFKKYEKD